ncbi:unnamed protein product [Paramecium sonneborni]|uniref:Uncharacterized protein n=1 Tax=Paramecium sonneborni TaxID=65129 RepID=A0A8S1MFV9_9CILI|nr:unnamed protein product [Paramecium sonneborni]
MIQERNSFSSPNQKWSTCDIWKKSQKVEGNIIYYIRIVQTLSMSQLTPGDEILNWKKKNQCLIYKFYEISCLNINKNYFHLQIQFQTKIKIKSKKLNTKIYFLILQLIQTLSQFYWNNQFFICQIFLQFSVQNQLILIY